MELKRTYTRTDKNGTKYYDVTYQCDWCGGKGIRPQYMHVEGGVCFYCDGAGVRIREVKEYTKEYAAKLEAKHNAKQEAKEAEAQAIRDAWKPLEIVKERMSFFNFGETIGIVINAKNGQPVKRYDEGSDWLYDANASKCLAKRGYYLTAMNNAEVLSYNGGIFQIVPMDWEEIIKVDRFNMTLDWQDSSDIDKAFNAKYDYTYPKTPMSKALGSVGERIKVTASIVEVKGYDTFYGMKYTYTFIDKNFNKMMWDTAKDLELAEGTEVSIVATVKEYYDWNEIGFITGLTRCKVSVA
ncbi:MAG: hypothetical protein IK038_02725 [Bacteroidaceae bacterium]|nr:hypothetical protein [Bacteroidaceae bacterium]